MQPLSGFRIVITGKIAGFTRADADFLASEAGATVCDEVKSTIDFILVANYDAGRPANTKKLKDAKAYHVPIIDASNLSRLCSGDIKPHELIQAEIQLNHPTPAPKINTNDFLSEAMADVPADYCI